MDASVRVQKGEVEKFRRLIRYMARPGISQERLTYDSKTGEVQVYSTKKYYGRRQVVATYNGPFVEEKFKKKKDVLEKNLEVFHQGMHAAEVSSNCCGHTHMGPV